MIIAAYAGTGKTTLANICPQKFTDFVCMPYKYILEDCGDFQESAKADPNNVMREEWPYNYVSAIKAILHENKHILIPTDLFVLALLQEENIPYTLCYPERNAKEIYRRRFISRDNTGQFVDIFIGNWDNYISAFERDTYGRQVVLGSNEYLSDLTGDFI